MIKFIMIDSTPFSGKTDQGMHLESYKANRRKDRTNLALSLMTLTVVFWGLYIISTKVVLSQIPLVSIASLRYAIATAILVPLALYTHSLPKIILKDLWTLVITSMFGIVLYFLFENNALQYTTTSNSSMLVAAMPLFALIIDALFSGSE